MTDVPLPERILKRLFAWHIGHGRGVRCRVLAQAVRASEREVREAITALRLAGEPIGAHPRWGYYIIETPEERRETCDFLRSRALHSLKLEARLLKVSPATLAGQMALELEEAG